MHSARFHVPPIRWRTASDCACLARLQPALADRPSMLQNSCECLLQCLTTPFHQVFQNFCCAHACPGVTRGEHVCALTLAHHRPDVQRVGDRRSGRCPSLVWGAQRSNKFYITTSSASWPMASAPRGMRHATTALCDLLHYIQCPLLCRLERVDRNEGLSTSCPPANCVACPAA